MGSESELKAGLTFVNIGTRIKNNISSSQECIKNTYLAEADILFQKSAIKCIVHLLTV